MAFVLGNPGEDRTLGLANVGGRTVTAGDPVDHVGRAVGRRRGLGAGEEVAERRG